MDGLQGIFNNRELAVGAYLMLAIVVLLLSRRTRKGLGEIFAILMDKKFVAFYFALISFLIVVLKIFKWLNLWDIGLLKDTVFWVVFAELPLCAKAITDAKDIHFFAKMIRENFKLTVLMEFFVSFWTFDFTAELLLVLMTIVVAFMQAIVSREKQYESLKKFFDGLTVVIGLILIINAICSTIKYPERFFNLETTKSFILPIILLIANLPVIYGLALYSGYEQLFIKIKNGAEDKQQMKCQLILFAGLNLTKIAAVRRNLNSTLHISLTPKDLRERLNMLKRHLSMQIGDNYMKRANYYIKICVTAAISSFVGIVIVNTDVSIKDILSHNFVFNIPRIKEILTYIFSVSLVFSIASMFYSIGFKKKKNEEITQIKKYALFEFLFVLKKQKDCIQEYPPVDDPISLFVNYMLIANELKEACTKAINVYGNLLNAWERESVEMMRTSAASLVANATIGGKNFSEYNIKTFCEYYKAKVKEAVQNKDFNSFTSMVKSDVERYNKRIEMTYADFEKYY